MNNSQVPTKLNASREYINASAAEQTASNCLDTPTTFTKHSQFQTWNFQLVLF